jgi:hypothetical protein
VLDGYVKIFSDVNFNAVGSVYARKLAEKATDPFFSFCDIALLKVFSPVKIAKFKLQKCKCRHDQ